MQTNIPILQAETRILLKNVKNNVKNNVSPRNNQANIRFRS